METSLCNKLRRYVFPYIDSNMYILVENSEALIIDPHISSDADRYLKENHVSKVTILLTHEHFDHICGIPWFRKHYDTKVICQQEALNPRTLKHFSRPLVVSLVLSDRGENEKIEALETEYPIAYSLTAEQTYGEVLDMQWQGHALHMEHMPGHSPASSIITMDEMCVFTGDSLIPDTEPTLRWPWSDMEAYQKRTVSRLLQIPKNYMICPGHRDMIEMKYLKYENDKFAVEKIK